MAHPISGSLIALLPLILAGLISPTTVTRDFPIGVYGVSPKELRPIAESGFTHVLSASKSAEAQIALAKAAKRAGLSLIGYPQTLLPAPSSGIPIAAWYLSDEPDVNNESPEDISRQAAEMRAKDSGTPLVLVVGDGSRAAECASHVDAVMVDWYPIPHLPLSSLGDHIATAVSQVPNKPIWAVVQAMDWRDYPQRDPKKKPIGRFPAKAEIRFMAYDAIVNGAAGIFFFEVRVRSRTGYTLLDSPEHWAALRHVSRELSLLRPILADGERTPLDFGPIIGVRIRHGRTRVTILANRSSMTQLLPQQFQSPECRTLFENRISPFEALPDGRMDSARILALAGC